MSRQEIEDLVIKVLALILKCDIDNLSSRKTVPQWDSLKQIEVIFALEDELKIQFPESRFKDLNSVAEIVDISEVLSATRNNH